MGPNKFLAANLRTTELDNGIGGLGKKVKEYGSLCYSVYTEFFFSPFSFSVSFSFILAGWVVLSIYVIIMSLYQFK